MIEKSVIMSFEDLAGKKLNITIKDVKEQIKNEDITGVMDLLVSGALLETAAGTVGTMLGAEIVTKQTEKVTL